MTKMNKRNFGLIAVAVAVLLAIGWYVGSPRWTLYQMKSAAEAGDMDRLASYIDFPALRASMKEEFRAHMAAEMLKSGNDGMAALGAAFAMNLIDNVVDGMVTPTVMRKVFVKNKAGGPAGMNAVDGAGDDLVFDRTSFDTFKLVSAKDKATSGALSFTRSGLGWRLTGLNLPDGAMATKTK